MPNRLNETFSSREQVSAKVFMKNTSISCLEIAQKIRLRLPSCGPLGSNPKHSIYTSLFQFEL